MCEHEVSIGSDDDEQNSSDVVDSSVLALGADKKKMLMNDKLKIL